MTKHVHVQLDALNGYAKAAEAISDGLTAIRSHLLAAGVTTDAFGMMEESRSAAEVYEERTTAGLEVLSSGSDGFSQIAEDMRQVRRNYEASDAFSAGLTKGPGA